MTSATDEMIAKLAGNRLLAHRFLFAHRHPKESPEFHAEIIDTWHDRQKPRVVTEAFRGGAKSTLLEETFVTRAAFREFRNGLLVGSSLDRAVERLEAIKYEIETNEELGELFGSLKGPVWAARKVVLSNGVVIQAFGREQSMRGTKHHDVRPDFCGIDDFEDDETVNTPEQRMKGLRWLYKKLLPALDRDALVRFIGHRLDPEAVIVKIAEDPEWYAQRFPVEYVDPRTHERRATWPAMFPIAWIDRKNAEYERQGLATEYQQEYMCEAVAEGSKTFRAPMIKVEARVRSWEATWCMFDPARTVNAKSNETGFAAWSYVGPKIIIWDGWSRKLMPDQIVSAMFDADEQLKPVAVGVESDGLNEWLVQPLRAEQLKRGRTLPFRPMAAPDSKDSFIRSMQPWFNAGEIVFAQELPALKQQLLSYPAGNKDGINALAYFTRMRPGAPMYEEFRQEHIGVDLRARDDRPAFLAMNATRAYVTGCLVQWVDRLVVLADYVEEGEPDEAAARIVTNARLEAGMPVQPVAGPPHFERWSSVGLSSAIARIPAELRRGLDPTEGRAHIRQLLRQTSRGLPAVLVSSRARWTLNGFAGGYARELNKGGMLAERAADGAYKVLMEGLESFAGLVKIGQAEEDEISSNFAYSADGRRYRSAMPRR